MVSKSGSSDRAKKEALRKSYADYASGESASHRNDTDFESFRQFHKEREARYRKTRRQSQIEQIKKNLAQWDENVHSDYKGLSLKGIGTRKSEKLIKAITADKNNRSVFVYADEPKGREKLIYGLLRDYINMGATSFSQILHLTENDLTLWATTGFQGQNRFDEKLDDSNINTIVVHGFSDKSYTEKELRLLENAISHCFYENKTLVFSSGAQLGTLSSLLTDSVASLLRSVVGKNVVNV